MADEETHISKVIFDFQRSNHFRVIHCDLVWGNLTPNEEIALTVFSDTIGHPTSVVHGVVEKDGVTMLGDELGREGDLENEFIVAREIEAKIVLKQRNAKHLAALLLRLIEQSSSDGDEEGAES